MTKMNTVKDIRQQFIQKYIDKDFIDDKTGVKLVEIIGSTFIADEDWIIRKPNLDYIERELTWYRSQSLNVNDIPGKTPVIWNEVADENGKINSNYGYLIFSDDNYSQYKNVYTELKKNPNSRRAVMIYNRPSMHEDYCLNGMSDFICTMYNSFFIRDNKLVSHYNMRSNDAVFGYDNDVAWARYVQANLANDLGIEVGDLIWTASSFHVYSYHFVHIEHLIRETVNESLN